MIYLRPHTATTGPVLIFPGGEQELTAKDAMNLTHTMVEFLWTHNVEIVERRSAKSGETALQEQGAIERREG